MSTMLISASVVDSIQDPSALAFWVKCQLHQVQHCRLTELRGIAKPWGFATARFNTAIRVLSKLGILEVYRPDRGPVKWVAFT